MENDPTIDQLLDEIRFKQASIDAIRSRVRDPGFPSSKLLLLAAASRSRELVRAFDFCSRERLLGVALAIGRMQLDSILRIHAASIVDDPNDFAEFILNGNEPKKYKLKERSPMRFGSADQRKIEFTDRFLYTDFSKKWQEQFEQLVSENPSLLHGHSDPTGLLSNVFGSIYKDGNMGVHLSNFHIMELFTAESLQGGNANLFRPVSGPGDETKIQAICVEMLFLVDQLLELLAMGFPEQNPLA